MNNDWLDIGVLEDYLDGKLDAKTMNKVEREALEDPFVAEALAGLSASPKRSLASISLLQKQLKERVAAHQVEKKTKVITWQRLSIAATAAVLFIGVSIIFWMKEVAQQNQLAQQGKEVNVNISPESPLVAAPAAPAADATPAVVAELNKEALAQNKPKKAIAPAAVASLSAAEQQRKELVMDQAMQQAAKANSYAVNAKKKASLAMAADSSPLAEQLESRVAGVAIAQNTYASPMAKSARIRGISTPMLQGKVVSDVNGEPLVGAAVRIVQATTGVEVTTDQNGEFKIPADSLSKDYTLAVRYPGFASNMKVARLNEQVAITLKKELMIGAAFNPVGGWEKYYQYLQENNQLTKTQTLGATLEISFLIGKDGKPYDFKVLRSLGPAYEKEAIRLISAGPKWEPPFNPEGRVRLGLKF